MEAGNFANQRKLLKAKIYRAAFNFCTSGIILLWFYGDQPKIPTRPIYLAEKIWFTSWIGSYMTINVFFILVAGYAYMRP